MKTYGIVRLTRDIEIKYTPTGTVVAEFAIAENRKVSGKETTMFLNCRAFGKTGEVLSEHFRKGDRLLILSSELGMDQWERDGEKRTSYHLTINDWAFVDRKEKAQEEGSQFGGRVSMKDLEGQGQSRPARRPLPAAPVDNDEVPF